MLFKRATCNKLGSYFCKNLSKKSAYFESANDEFVATWKKSINPVSYIGKKQENCLDHPMKTKLEKVHLEIAMDKSLCYQSCKQLLDYCYRKKYSDYIKKKVFYIYKNQASQPASEHIQEEIKEAYNKKLRVDFHARFNCYDGADYELPDCLYSYSIEIVHMIHELVECTVINCKTREGIVQLIKTKRHCKAAYDASL